MPPIAAFTALCRIIRVIADRLSSLSIPPMTRAERTTVLLLLAIGATGQVARLALESADPPGQALMLPGSQALELARQRNAASAADRPLSPGQRIDPNTASARDLARMPGVGMRLAKEIVSDREIRGVFGSLASLDRVAGIGPGMLRRMEPFLLVPARSAVPGAGLDLNLATPAELEQLPGLGPARAKAIVAYRDRNGPFTDPTHVDRVPGIGSGLALRLAPLLTVR
jgi:competence ComEA-like helix-hairpin-helix protein